MASTLAQQLQNETRAFEAVTKARSAKHASQPYNTRRMYEGYQEQWVAWCKKHDWSDGYIVREDKLILWLTEDILQRRGPPSRTKKRKYSALTAADQEGDGLNAEQVDELAEEARLLALQLGQPVEEALAMLIDDRVRHPAPSDPNGELLGALLQHSTIDVYVSAVLELYKEQSSHGNNPHPNPRTDAVAALIHQRRRDQDQIAQENYADKGEGSYAGGYTKAELIKIQQILLVDQAELSFRTRFDILAGHHFVLRGQSRRQLCLADISVKELAEHEGSQPYLALIFAFSKGKTNKVGRKELMGSIRHQDPLLCSHGALAQYLFWRFHISGEEPPSFRHRKDWYDVKALVTTTQSPKATAQRTELAYAAQAEEIMRVFRLAGVMSGELTHAMRGCASREDELHGIAQSQMSRAGPGKSGVLTLSYLTELPLEFMRSMAGFGTGPRRFFLARAAHLPPEDLQKQVFPWLEHWEKHVQLQKQGKGWSEGGLDQPDLVLKNFIQLMKHLRIVLLQDLAVLQPAYPRIPLLTAQVFKGPAWTSFASLLQKGQAHASEQLASKEQLQVQQEVANLLTGGRDAILHSVNQRFDSIDQKIDRLQATVDSLVNLINGQPNPRAGLGLGVGLQDPPSPPPTATNRALRPSPTSPASPARPTGPQPTGPQPTGSHPTESHPTESHPTESQPKGPQPTEPQPTTAAATTATAPNPSPSPSSPPVYTLSNAKTIPAAWLEWKHGLAGGPALSALEERWGHRWRPEKAQRVAWSRRKKLLDEIRRLIAGGMSEEAAVAELERRRAGRSLWALINEL